MTMLWVDMVMKVRTVMVARVRDRSPTFCCYVLLQPLHSLGEHWETIASWWMVRQDFCSCSEQLAYMA